MWRDEGTGFATLTVHDESGTDTLPLNQAMMQDKAGNIWFVGSEKEGTVESDVGIWRYDGRNIKNSNIKDGLGVYVERSQDWEWSSLKPTARSGPAGLLCDGPILKPAQWTRRVNGVETEAELQSLRHSLARGTPFGDTRWQKKTAAELGLESSLRPRGRPKRSDK